jgi:isocitrate/isopropylmalate dehydrogenase
MSGNELTDVACSASPVACLQVTLIPGDGIGPELADSVKEIFTALNVPVEFDQYDVSGETGGDETVFKAAMDSLKRNKVGLKGTHDRELACSPADRLTAS